MPKDRPGIGGVVKELNQMSVYPLPLRLTSCLDSYESREYIQPSKKLSEEPRVPIPGPLQVVGVDIEPPLPGPTPPSPKAKANIAPAPKKTRVVGKGLTTKPTSRLKTTVIDGMCLPFT